VHIVESGRTRNVKCRFVRDTKYLLPDLMLVAPLPRSAQPTTAHLVVEVAQTSQARDGDKARDYAVADVPEYWIVDLLGRKLVVHRHPLAGAYQEIEAYADGALR